MEAKQVRQLMGKWQRCYTWPVCDMSMSQSAAVSLQGESKEVVTQNAK